MTIKSVGLFLKKHWFLVMSVFLVAGAFVIGSNYGAIENQLIAHKASAVNKNKKVQSASDVKRNVANGNASKPEYYAKDPTASATPSDIMNQLKKPNNESLRGYVSVPSYGIKQPVYEGVSSHVLALGVGLFEPNATFGKGYVSLFGHNMDDFNTPYPTKFSAMQNMRADKVVGQEIVVTTGDKTYRYKITDFRRGVPVSALDKEVSYNENNVPAKPTIQLVACDEDAQFQQQLRDSNYTDFTAKNRLVLTGVLE